MYQPQFEHVCATKMAKNGNDVKMRRHGTGAFGSSCAVLSLLPNEVFMKSRSSCDINGCFDGELIRLSEFKFYFQLSIKN